MLSLNMDARTRCFSIYGSKKYSLLAHTRKGFVFHGGLLIDEHGNISQSDAPPFSAVCDKLLYEQLGS
jgi:hypothetical protein